MVGVESVILQYGGDVPGALLILYKVELRSCVVTPDLSDAPNARFLGDDDRMPRGQRYDRSRDAPLVSCQRSQLLAHLVHAPRHGRLRYPQNGPGLRMTQTFLEHKNRRHPQRLR